MSDFKTQADILRALLEGKRVQCKGFDYYVEMKDGFVVKSDGSKFSPPFRFPGNWHLLPDPPQVVEFECDCNNTSVRNTFARAADPFAPILHGKRWRVVCTEIKDDE